MNALFTTPITNTGAAEIFLFQLHDLGLSFHPEDNAQSIINAKSGEAVFTTEEAVAINARMEEVFMYLDDPCDYLLNLIYSTDRQ